MRHALATALLVAATGFAAPISAAQADTPTCDGRAATIVGTDGADTLTGTSGDDVIVGGPGPDTIDGGDGNDVICGGGGRDRLYGGAGDDWISGDDGSKDTYVGGPGDDQFVVVAPQYAWMADVLDYGTAANGIDADLSAGTITGQGHDSVLPVGAPITLRGTPYADTLTGSSGNDRMFGGRGDDVLHGGAGFDDLRSLGRHSVAHGGQGYDDLKAHTMYGGAGMDDLDMSMRTSRGYGGTGHDHFWIHTWVDPKQFFDGGDDAADTVPGNALRLTVHQDRARLDLAKGTISADGVTEHFRGSFTTLDLDTSYVSHMTVLGTDQRDYITEDASASLVVHGRGGDDEIELGGGNDTIYGGDGTDSVNAGGGTDTCWSVEQGIYGRPTHCETSNP